MIWGITDAMLVSGVRSPAYLEALRTLQLHWFIFPVPLVANGRALGAMTFVSAESRRHYTRRDLPFAETVARRAAVAIDNARAYGEAQAREPRRRTSSSPRCRTSCARRSTRSSAGRSMLRSAGGSTRGHRQQRARDHRAQRARAGAAHRGPARRLAHHLRQAAARRCSRSTCAHVVAGARSTRCGRRPRRRASRSTSCSTPARRGDPATPTACSRWCGTCCRTRSSSRRAAGASTCALERVGVAACEIAVTRHRRRHRAEFLPHVFERFRQADEPTTRAHGGLGLGLAIVARTSSSCTAGTVRGAPARGPDRGATFTVVLPILDRRRGRRPPRPGPSAAPATTGTLVADAPDLGGARVLVVKDDGEDVARESSARCCAQCRRRSWRADGRRRPCGDGPSVGSPDVLVSEVEMPRGDGLLAHRGRCGRVPADQGGTVPAAALTAYSRAGIGPRRCWQATTRTSRSR